MGDGEGGVKLRLKILAWCHVVFGSAGLALFGTLVVAYGLANDRAYDDEFAWMAGGLGLLTLAYFLPSFLGGIGLLRGIPAGAGDHLDEICGAGAGRAGRDGDLRDEPVGVADDVGYDRGADLHPDRALGSGCGRSC